MTNKHKLVKPKTKNLNKKCQVVNIKLDLNKLNL